MHDVSLLSQPVEAELQRTVLREPEYDVYVPDEELDSQVYQFDVSKGTIFAVTPHDVSFSNPSTSDLFLMISCIK